MTKAHVNWGRWVVDCECGSAENVSAYPDRVRCKACGETIAVEYPRERAGIEAVLAHRPATRVGSQRLFNHRNWRPGESVTDLRRENREHGLPDSA